MQNSTKAWCLASLMGLSGCLASGEEEGASADEELGTLSNELSESAVRTRVVGDNTDGDTQFGDQFGASVALSDDGLTLVVGAEGEDSGSAAEPDDDSKPYSGAAYVFTRPTRDADWVQQGYLKASNPDIGDELGNEVAISADGKYVAVGAVFEASNGTSQSDNSMKHAGAVYVFRYDDVIGDWVQDAYLKASRPRAGSSFGTSVALNSDGTTLAVGAAYEGNDSSQPGGAYVFRRGPSGWTEQALVKASNADSGDQFGRKVALNGSGNLLAVGAPFETSGATGVDGNAGEDLAGFHAGAVYVFELRNSAWKQQSYIKASNTDRRAEYGDEFGSALALSSDGSTLAVGAPDEDSAARRVNGDERSDAANASGAAYVFRATANGSWKQEAYVKPNNTDTSDQFASALALSNDGNYLVVGAPNEASNASEAVGGNPFSNVDPGRGAAYVFARVGTEWAQQAYLKPERSRSANALPPEGFGSSVDIDETGDVISVNTNRYSRKTAGVFTFTDL